jgi:hypothetical protein
MNSFRPYNYFVPLGMNRRFGEGLESANDLPVMRAKLNYRSYSWRRFDRHLMWR